MILSGNRSFLVKAIDRKSLSFLNIYKYLVLSHCFQEQLRPPDLLSETNLTQPSYVRGIDNICLQKPLEVKRPAEGEFDLNFKQKRSRSSRVKSRPSSANSAANFPISLAKLIKTI